VERAPWGVWEAGGPGGTITAMLTPRIYTLPVVKELPQPPAPPPLDDTSEW
jgi:hypothetical protein